MGSNYIGIFSLWNSGRQAWTNSATQTKATTHIYVSLIIHGNICSGYLLESPSRTQNIISRNVRKRTFWQERPKKTENNITKIYLCNFDPLKPHFYIVQLGFTGVYIIFLISAQNIDCGYPLEPPLRGKAVLTSTHNLRFGQKYEKYQNFLSENFPFLFVKFSIYLNRRVFVMMHTCAVRFLFLLSTWRHFAPLAIWSAPSEDFDRTARCACMAWGMNLQWYII